MRAPFFLSLSRALSHTLLAPSPASSQLDIHAVFAAFVWDDDVGAGSGRYPPFDHREIDTLEVSRWGNPTDPAAYQFVLQPPTANNVR